MDPVEEAAQVLMHDGIVIYPTDTVYGLGGDAFSDEAILKVYEAKTKAPLTAGLYCGIKLRYDSRCSKSG